MQGETLAADASKTKRCSTCKRTLEIGAFWLSRFRPDGRQNQCRDCHRIVKAESFRRRRAGLRVTERRVRIQRAQLDARRALAERNGGACTCGALQEHHRNGKGSCAATGCPEWFPRGE